MAWSLCRLIDTEEASLRLSSPYSSSHTLSPATSRSSDLDKLPDDEPTAALQFLIQPRNAQTLVTERIAQNVDFVYGRNSWVALLPRYIGHTLLVDAAAVALSYLFEYGWTNQVALLDSAIDAYKCASKLLQANLANSSTRLSDEVLLTVNVLSICDYLSRGGNEDGMKALALHQKAPDVLMLQKRQAGETPSDVVRGLIHCLRSHWFYTTDAVIQFEDPYWLEMEPLVVAGVPPELRRLRKRTTQVYVRLAHLRRLVGALRADKTASAGDAVSLARSLLQLEDTDAESFILHRPSVRPTENLYDRKFVPNSFRFANSVDMNVAENYWVIRMILLRFCIWIASLGFDDFDGYPLMEMEERMMKNHVMCWQQIFKQELGHKGLLHALPSVWSSLRGRTQFHGTSIANFANWILCLTRRELPNIPITAQDLDSAADALCGAPGGEHNAKSLLKSVIWGTTSAKGRPGIVNPHTSGFS